MPTNNDWKKHLHNLTSQCSSPLKLSILLETKTVANALSRVDAIDMPVIVTTKELAQEQAIDQGPQQFCQAETLLKLKELTVLGSSLPLYCDCSKRTVHPYVPYSLRKRIFDAIHEQHIPVASQRVNKYGKSLSGQTQIETPDAGLELVHKFVSSAAQFSVTPI